MYEGAAEGKRQTLTDTLSALIGELDSARCALGRVEAKIEGERPEGAVPPAVPDRLPIEAGVGAALELTRALTKRLNELGDKL